MIQANVCLHLIISISWFFLIIPVLKKRITSVCRCWCESKILLHLRVYLIHSDQLCDFLGVPTDEKRKWKLHVYPVSFSDADDLCRFLWSSIQHLRLDWYSNWFGIYSMIFPHNYDFDSDRFWRRFIIVCRSCYIPWSHFILI